MKDSRTRFNYGLMCAVLISSIIMSTLCVILYYQCKTNMPDLSTIWGKETNGIRATHLKSAEEKRKAKDAEETKKNTKKK
jgi:hypothetical protein